MEADYPLVYVLIMKILGVATVTIGSISLYLIVFHSGKIGKEYKYALTIHHSLLLLSLTVLDLGYIPITVPPYIAFYPGGYLKDYIPSSVLFIFQMSACMVSVTSLGPLFHLRTLAVLSPSHYLARPSIKYSLFGYYFIPSILINLVIFPFVFWDQETIKQALLESYQVNDSFLFNANTLAFPLVSTSMSLVLWIGMTAFGVSTFIFASVIFTTMTFTALNNMKTNLSQRTRIMQRKLIINLIVQALFYNCTFVGLTIFACVYTVLGRSTRSLCMTIFWTYGSLFILGCILLILTSDSYKQAVLKLWCPGNQKITETVVVVTTRC